MSTPADANERAVVGAALLDPESVRFALDHCTPDDFQNQALARLWELIIGLRSAALPVDPISVMTAARERGMNHVDGPALHGLKAETPTASNVAFYARKVAEAAGRRRLAQFGMRAMQLADAGEDFATVMTHARDEWEHVRNTNRHAGHAVAKTLAEILDGSDEYDWLIPQLLERQDRLILTGGEGAGKSTFTRQIAILAAAGLHPITFRTIEPVRTLVVDAENTEKQWRRKARPLTVKARMQGQIDPAQAMHVWNAQRLDITTDRDLGEVHRLVDEHQPDLLLIGPLYRLIPRAINSDDDAAPLLAALDTLRDRGLALVMEAHAGHAVTRGGDRDLRPRGSSALMGWPEFGLGIALDHEDPDLAHLVRWRGDRDERDWPRAMRRGGDWPWTDARTAGRRPGEWTPSTSMGRTA